MIVLDPGRLSSLGDDELDAMASARECVVAIAAGRLGGAGAAALLLSDFAVLENDGTIVFDAPVAWAGLIWRVGDRALRSFLESERARFSGAGGREVASINAARAHALGAVDELFQGHWKEWLDGWLAHRSSVALDSAALLTARRGGDVLERVEFARLFATGEPQHGMDAFLGKRKPQFGK